MGGTEAGVGFQQGRLEPSLMWSCRGPMGGEVAPERLDKALPCRSSVVADCGSSQTTEALKQCTLLGCHAGTSDGRSKWF